MSSVAARIAALLVLVAALCAGLWLGGHPSELPGPIQDAFVDENTSLQAEATEQIQRNYYRKVPAGKLRDASIKGMVRSLHSRFSAYFTPAQNKLFTESTSGQYSGVGMNVLEHRRGLIVTGLAPGSPAARARIHSGDLVTAVNGRSIAGEPSAVSTARIKGPPGTPVTLELLSHGQARSVRLRRKNIKVPVVAGMMRRSGGHKLGVVRIVSFTSGVHGAVRDQVSRLQKRGAQGFVVDLRGNGGGLLDEAVFVSSVFIPNGRIVTTKGRTKPRVVYDASGDALTRKPLVVLVDRGTASASEIVTAALEERLGSRVVGRPTFGKGVFGQVFGLSNGGALDLVVGNYYTANGSSINGTGVKPDVPLSRRVSSNPRLALDRALEVLAAEVARGGAGKGK